MNFAEIILSQIGRGALFMIGAKEFTYSEKGQTVRFRIGRNAKTINVVAVKLTPDDLYTLEFWRIRGHRSTLVSSVDGLYAEDLARTIGSETGMATALPRVVGLNA